ncbi:hypothetical protein K490DRAFT_17018, partial [Saccharata proteae CBS 121410]
ESIQPQTNPFLQQQLGHKPPGQISTSRPNQQQVSEIFRSTTMVQERPRQTSGDANSRPPQAAPNPLGHTMNSVPQFGTASPLRSPFKKDAYAKPKPRSTANPLIIREPGAVRPEWHKTNTKGFPHAQPVPIAKPNFSASTTIAPAPRPTYTSERTSGGFQPINSHYQPPKPTVDLTNSDDEFDPDALIRNDNTFGAPDPFMYVDSKQADDNIKALLEGAFDEDDDKPKTRLRKRKQKEKKKEDEPVLSLADKLEALKVQAHDDKPKPEPEEEEEDEDDGTVDGLNVKLLPHQVDGVAWMTDKEVGQRKKNGVLPKGGILADDMGLGKTIQSLALILNNPRPDPDSKDPEDKKQKIPAATCRSTLVVAPLALIKQWESEIKTKVLASHKLKVLVHHGQSRTKRADDLKKYDVVITTYQILASEHSGSSDEPNGPKIGCFGVHWYRIMLDEAHSIKNRNAKMSQAACALKSHYRWCLTGTPMQNNLDELQSLIKFLRIKPYNDLSRWKADIGAPMKNGRGNLAMRRLQVFLKAFMKRRTKDVLKKDGALNPGGKPTKEGEESKGFRIVDRKIETVTATFDAKERRFYDKLADKAQNRLAEIMGGEKSDYIGALVLLLRLRQACNHPELVGGQVGKDFKDALATAERAPSGTQTPRKSKVEENKEADDLADLLGGLTVAAKNCDICQIELSPSEASSGRARCTDCDNELQSAKNRNKKKKKKHGRKHRKTSGSEKKEDEDEDSSPVQQKIMRKKPVIMDSDDEEEGEGEWLVSEDKQLSANLGRAGGTDDEDAEGGGDTLNSIDSQTGDEDESALSHFSGQKQKNVVALVTTDEEEEQGSDDSATASESEEAYNSEDSSASLKNLVSSTKIRRLLQILRDETPDHKVIVFSQFTSMLDLIEPFLRKEDLSFTRYDGSMRNDHREASLNRLRNDKHCRVLLCSLKCGSLGLNLTAASRVVILEPFWNPFVEEQAIDRVHRLNQTVDVVVYKLTIASTVEERILDLQEAKRKLANAAIEGGKAINKLSMKDIMNLFRRDAEHE